MSTHELGVCNNLHIGNADVPCQEKGCGGVYIGETDLVRVRDTVPMLEYPRYSMMLVKLRGAKKVGKP